MKKLYLEVTQDIYELPLIVADSLDEMARLSGFPKSYISADISKWKAGTVKRGRFRIVKFEEGGEDWND